MIHETAIRIINWQILNGFLNEKDRNKYVYAYEVLVNQVLNISIAAFLAIAAHKLKEIIVFLIVYIPLRKYAGGYHAKSNEKCILYSSAIIVLIIFLNMLSGRLLDNPAMVILSLFLAMSGVWSIAPVESVNKVLNVKERIKYKRKIHIYCAVHVAAVVLNALVLKQEYILLNITFGYIAIFLLLLKGRYK